MFKYLLALALFAAPMIGAQTNTIPTTSRNNAWTGTNSFTHLTIPSLTGCLFENGSGIISGVSCAPSTLSGDANGPLGSNTVTRITVDGTSVPFAATGSSTNAAPLIFSTNNGGEIIWGPLYVPASGGTFIGGINGTTANFSGQGVFQSVILSGLTPSNATLCAHGTSGAITNVGCASNFVQSLTTNNSSGASTVVSGVLNIPVYAGKGANSDITSLSALSTPLSIVQGGTGNTAGQAVTALSLAATGTPCANGLAPTGVDASGNSVGCQPIGTDAFTYPGIIYATSPSSGTIATSTQLVTAINTTPISTTAFERTLIPVASDTLLGGVICDGVTIDCASNGVISAIGGGGTPAGPTGSMQYNNSSSFGGLNGNGIPLLNGTSAPTIAASADIVSQLNNNPTTLLSSQLLPPISGGEVVLGNALYGYQAFGDSITAGVGSLPNASSYYVNGYAQLLSADVNFLNPTFAQYAITSTTGKNVNYAQSGIQAWQMNNSYVYPFAAPTNSTNPLVTVDIGTNDVGNFAQEAQFRTELNATIAWLTTSSTYKVLGQDATCTNTGTWTNSAVYGGAMALASDTNGSTLTCTIVTHGGPIYEGYLWTDSTAGTVSWTIDGVSQGTLTSAPPTCVNDGVCTGNSTPALARVTGIAAGSHTVVFTVTSSTSTTNTFTQIWLGSPAPSILAKLSGQPPNLYMGGILKQYLDANSSETAQWDADVQAAVALFQEDGQNVFYVPVRNYVNDDSDMAVNASGPCLGGITPLHPNNCGHQHEKDAFEAVINSTTASPGASGSGFMPFSGGNFLANALVCGFGNGGGSGKYCFSSYNSGSPSDSTLDIGSGAFSGNQTTIYTGAMQLGGSTQPNALPSGTLIASQTIAVMGNGAAIPNSTQIVSGSGFGELQSFAPDDTHVNDIYVVGRNSNESLNDFYMHCIYLTGCVFADPVIFDQDASLIQQTAATSSANVNSPNFSLTGNVMHAGVSTPSKWTCFNDLSQWAGSPTDASSILTCDQTGSSGQSIFKVPNLSAVTVTTTALNAFGSSSSFVFGVANSTTATAGANQGSPHGIWSGAYWNGSTGNNIDEYGFRNVIPNGTNPNTTFLLEISGSPGTHTVDFSAATSFKAAQYLGPATAPSGTCTTDGAWVFSQDGHATFCASGTWVSKI